MGDCYGDPATKSLFPPPLHANAIHVSYQLTSLRNKSFFLSSLTRTHDAKGLACSRRSGRGGWRDNESGRGNGG